METEEQGEGGGEGWGGWGGDGQRNRQVNAQALSKLPFSNLPFSFSPMFYFSAPNFRDAEMTIKLIISRLGQTGGRQGFEKRVNRGPSLIFYCRPKAQEKQHFGKSHFYCRRFWPGNAVTIILDSYPPSTIVGENSFHAKIQPLFSRTLSLFWRR